mgnify:FL=1|jgi:septal ring factor EnvC (AmiA/AmiB activator)
MASPASAPTSEFFQLQKAIETLIEEKFTSLQEEINKLRTENKDLWNAIETTRLDIAYDRKRISKLELRGNLITSTTKEHLEHLKLILAKRAKAGQAGLTVAQAAKSMQISKPRMKQLLHAIKLDDHFIVGQHPKRANAFVIELNKETTDVDRILSDSRKSAKR